MTRTRRWRTRLIVYAVAIPVGYGLGAMFDIRGLAESRLFYFPNRDHFLRSPTAQEVWITTPEGLKLHAWFFPAQGHKPGDPPAPALLHVHGNAGSINWHTEFSSFLIREGFSILIFDYRGYGKSDLPRRRLCREDLVVDTRAALEYLASRPDVDPERIAIYGVSLGAVIGAAAAAEDPRARAVVSISGFSSWQGVARDHGGSVACRIIRAGLDEQDSVQRLGERPLLIVHGQRDQIVPPHHATRLADAAKSAGVPVDVLLDPEGDHNEIIYTNPGLQKSIADWLRKALGVAP